jgi:hypothetical protein
MGESKLSKVIFNVQKAITKHSPEILTGLGIAGMLTTTVLAVKATPRALQLIELEKEDKDVDELTPMETVKATWKCYIPAAMTATTSVACLIGASSVHLRRNAALATAYKLSETAFAEYREKTIETIGERKESAIRDRIDKKHIDENPVSKTEVILTEKGNSLCYDHWSGRYFRSDIDQINRAINEVNRQMLVSMGGFVTLNDLYDELGLSHTLLGETLGWRIDNGLIEPRLGSQIADDGTPCIVLDYNIPPTKDTSHY